MPGFPPRSGKHPRGGGKGYPAKPSASSDREKRFRDDDFNRQDSQGSRSYQGDRSERPRRTDRSNGYDAPRSDNRNRSEPYRSESSRRGDYPKKSTGGDKPRSGDRFNDRQRSGDFPRNNDNRGNDRSRFNEREPRRTFSDKPRFDRPRPENKNFQRDSERRQFDRNNDRNDGRNPRNYRDDRPRNESRPRFNEQNRQSFTGKPHREQDDRPRFNERPGFTDKNRRDNRDDRSVTPRRNDDRPQRFSEKRRDDHQRDDRREKPRREHPQRPPFSRTDRKPPVTKAPAKEPAPSLPEGAELAALDTSAKRELSTLPKSLAEIVGAHLAAAGMLMDTEPELALAHARYAKSKSSRSAVVREALGFAAYNAGEWAEALSELRSARRMSNNIGHVAMMADCERALGRPERAIDLIREADLTQFSKPEQIELTIVAAGARRDMGQLDAAIVTLQGKDLDPTQQHPWSARLFYAYADNLQAAGRTEEAIQWFLHAAEADPDEETDASERVMELSQGE